MTEPINYGGKCAAMNNVIHLVTVDFSAENLAWYYGTSVEKILKMSTVQQSRIAQKLFNEAMKDCNEKHEMERESFGDKTEAGPDGVEGI